MRTGAVRSILTAAGLIGALLLVSCASPRKGQPLTPKGAWVSTAVRGSPTGSGNASYYGAGFQGKRTASGERFNMHALTAAHNSLPFGTKVRVTNLSNGKSVIVRINDRGPSKGNRIIDLSYEAARRIGMVREGVVRVSLEVVR
jgi:rare lipoprotein A